MEAKRRPFYESAADRKVESAIISKVEETLGLKAAKLKPSLRIDYALTFMGRVHAFAEVKARAYTWDQIDRAGGYMISLDKWIAARSMCGSLPFILAVEAAGDLRVYRVTKWEEFPISVGGRRDRGDWQDLEPCVFIPAEKFHAIEGARSAA